MATQELAAENRMAPSDDCWAGLGWRRCVTLQYTDIRTGAEHVAHGTVKLAPPPAQMATVL